MEATIYNQEAKEDGKITLPDEVFGLQWNADLVHQVIRSMQHALRTNTAHTKTRGEVSGGGKKPWRQKGTGRARHGSSRSPLWKGGGTTFGPRSERSYDLKINKKMKTKALYTVLSAKARDKEILFVSDLSITTPKTKEANDFLNRFSKVKGFEKIAYKKGNRALLLVPDHQSALVKSFRNIPQAFVEEVRNANPLLIGSYKYVMIVSPEKSLKLLEGRKLTTKKISTNK